MVRYHFRLGLLFIYLFGIVVMLPFSSFSHFGQMQPTDWLVALFCAFNTLLAYGCFAQAMKYWPMSQLGPAIALTPIVSFSTTAVVVALGWWPQTVKSDELDALALSGVVLVILSVMGIQLLPKLQAKLSAKKSGKLETQLS